jgi:hypothetical protein
MKLSLHQNVAEIFWHPKIYLFLWFGEQWTPPDFSPRAPK